MFIHCSVSSLPTYINTVRKFWNKVNTPEENKDTDSNKNHCRTVMS